MVQMMRGVCGSDDDQWGVVQKFSCFVRGCGSLS